MQFTRTVLLAGLVLSGAAHAQPTGLDQRVGKLEKEMKAVQRTVFPQGAPVQPEISAMPNPETAGSPASTPLSDLTTRIDTLEKSFAALTGQIEQATFQNRQQDDLIKALEARLKSVEGSDIAAQSAAAEANSAVTAPATPAPGAKPADLSTRSDPTRKAAVAAVEIPATGDAAEDAYTYGFRLYSAKLYPEAQVKLKEFVAKHPAHRRASYAQNLLGRAYYDEGKPALASVAFYDNYQKMPSGDRAAESLYWLGQSLTKLKKLPDACKVYDELEDVYRAKLTPDMKARAAKGRVDAKCTA